MKKKRIQPINTLLLLLLWLMALLPALAQQEAAEDDGFTNQPTGDGKVAIKETNYPIPTDGTARYVKTNGDDSKDGKSWDNAWKTLKYALLTGAPTGATIVLRGGTYREGEIRFRKKFTLQPAPKEEVWIKGSEPVSDWVKEGALWYAPWTKTFPNDTLSCFSCVRRFDKNGKTTASGRVTEESAAPASREMVFVNSIGLKQVLNKAKIAPGKFYFDYTNNRIYLAENPSGKTIESTALESGFEVVSSGSDGTIIRGLGFRDYAKQAVLFYTSSSTFENNTVVWNAINGFGAGLGSERITLRGNVFSYNGMTGASIGGANVSCLVEENVFSYNNVEDFAGYWAAAGIKVIHVDKITFRRNLFERNYAMGLWMDLDVEDAVVVHNTARHNTAIGIFFEVSRGIIIAGNVCYGNATGIMISGSSDAKIYNNTLVGNVSNVRVKDTGRKNDTSSESARAAQIARGVDFETREVVLKNNIMANATSNCFAVGQDPCETESMMEAMDYNLYWRSKASVGADLIDWNPLGCPDTKVYPTHKKYLNLSSFRTAVGLEKKGLGVDDQSINGLFADSARNDFDLAACSPALNAGEPLPADVAAALGWPAGKILHLGARQDSPLVAKFGITDFSLINADTDAPVAGFDPIAEGAVINLSTLPTRNLNLRANTSGNVGSVSFAYDANTPSATAHTALYPYALGGTTAGNYAAWTPLAGRHTLSATPFCQATATGAKGTTLTIAFRVADGTVMDAIQARKLFSPALDGVWGIEGIEACPECRVSIFSRGGVKIYESAAYRSRPWDGTYQGKPLTQGGYSFVIRKEGKQNLKTGTVTLLR